MANKKPGAFQHIDGGLREQLQENVVDASRPPIERIMSGVALLVARGLLDQVNKDGLALPGQAEQPAAVPNVLPPPPEFVEYPGEKLPPQQAGNNKGQASGAVVLPDNAIGRDR